MQQNGQKRDRFGLRLFKRVAVIYLVLYLLPFPIPQFELGLEEVYYGLWRPLIEWVGGNIFNTALPMVLPNGSGDTTYNYVQIFVFFVLALLLGTGWTIAERKDRWEILSPWIDGLLRYYLVLMLFGYGIFKVFPLQFPEPASWRYVQLFGDMSPMGLAWTFVGHSYVYSSFAGWAEVIAASLLVFRRTALFGALFATTVMTNVVILNFAYDIPVKLFSSHLLVFCIALIAPYWPRLWAFFVSHSAIGKQQFRPWFTTPWKLRAHQLITGSYLIILIGFSLYGAVSFYQENLSLRKQNPRAGLYKVEHFIVNGDTLVLQPNCLDCWRHVSIASQGSLVTRMANDSIRWYTGSIDSTMAHLTASSADSSSRFSFQLSWPDSLYVVFSGQRFTKIDSTRFRTDTLGVVATRVDLKSTRMARRGFHWINEYPYNR